MPLQGFHPAVAAWFDACFAAPTPPQTQAWPEIQRGRHTLIAAPTGSGKTLAAFLAAIDDLIRRGLGGPLANETQVVYVSPLKALSNDIERNLQWPLAGIRNKLIESGLPDVDIRVLVRTGDTTQAERAAMRKQPPHILVTTPESLYLLLSSDSGRAMLRSTRSVIVDEIHALAGSKRGSHLMLSLERLQALCPQALTRIGLSATQKPIEEIARFLVGDRPLPHPSPRRGEEDAEGCFIVDTGHARDRDLALELPGAPLEAVMSAEVWQEVYNRLAQLIGEHGTTLVFVNTRRLAERAARHLSERLGKEHVTSHHGSLAKEQRLAAEQKLKNGELKALVATASLELGIDIGNVDLVCQLGSPRSIAAFLQRVGRSGHAIDAMPKGRLFPLSRDDLIECTALQDSVRRGELDRLHIPAKPLDVLAQQIVADVACREWHEDELYETLRRAHPYRALARTEFDAVVRMLADGFSTRRGRRSAYLHRDAVNQRLRARRGTRLTAVTCGGAIPDTADYRVILEPAEIFIGTLNEDFAIESMPGDIFQLGNASYRILKIESGRVRVADAQGAPPSIPFWFGEAPGRTDELSASVSRLLQGFERRLGHVSEASLAAVTAWLTTELALEPSAARQLAEYLAAAKGVLGALPSADTIILERFFDESGGMQLVLHAPFGSRINRAWGLALRKRFCRQFNFELQAAATEDAIVLSLGETHSFPLEDVARYLHSASVREVLVQALLDAPLFTTRWRWVATIALAVKRFRGGRKHPAPLQRMDAEDLIAVVFPDQLACAENLTGQRAIPDHPLVNQTIDDCLHAAMDVDGLVALLRDIEHGARKIITRDLPQPSPLAQEILNAKPYAFLDDAPLEERRTQAVLGRRWLDPIAAQDLGKLDPAAIQKVREEAWPQVGHADELHDALMLLGFITETEGEGCTWQDYLATLIAERRATRLCVPTSLPEPRSTPDPQRSICLWVAAEQLPLLQAVLPQAMPQPKVSAPAEYVTRAWTTEAALVEIVRGRLQGLGPITASTCAAALGLETAPIDAAFLALESEGFVLRGQFTTGASTIEWCERRLLARIHRYTVQQLRAEIEPVAAADFLRFLCDWHGLTADPKPEGPQALAGVIEQLEGFEAAAVAWEGDILPARLQDYDPDWLDGLCLAGRSVWTRLMPPKGGAREDRGVAPVRTTPVALLTRRNLNLWQALVATRHTESPGLSSGARTVREFLQQHGATFFPEIVQGTGLLRTQVEAALAELVALGLLNSDSFIGLRALLLPTERRRHFDGGRRRRRKAGFGIEDAGRWVLLRRDAAQLDREAQRGGPGDASPTERGGVGTDMLEAVARILLRRYGVVFKQLLARERSCLPPWYELLRVYRRLEARGEIRGGRFVAGFSGEQYALPEAVGALRAVRKKPKTGMLVSISAADPLNLVGILTPRACVPALAGNRVLFRDGVPVAVHVGGATRFIELLAPTDEWAVRNALLRPSTPPPLRAYLN